jgi:formylglycine-generating enzyme required for sulfatase activity
MTERDIFLALLDLPDPAARAAYLDRACGGDAALRARVEGLIRSHEAAGSFLATPAVAAPEADHAATRAFNPDTAATRTDETPGTNDESLGFLAPPGRPDSLGRLGHYEVLQVLGRGGFGIVFRAFDDVLQRVVAVKVLAPQMAATSPARKRFLREARSSAAVRHENVVQVYAVEEQPLPYLVMEFIPGETLQQRLDRTGPLDVPEILRIGRQIAEGLAAAHATELIHRDIKPANLLIEGGAHHRVKITDFGLARAADDASISQSGVVAGTPMYMAPEQAKGDSFDHRADLFSLGSLLYAMSSGHPPFRATTTLAVLKRVAEDTPRPIREVIPEVPEWFCRIVEKLHAKNPAERFQSAREVADLLADCEQQLRTHGILKDYSRIPGGKPAPRRSGRRKWAVAALALVLLVVGAVVWAGPHAIRYVGNRGEIEITPESGWVSVIVHKDGIAVTDWFGVKTAPTIKLPPGKYKLEPGFAPGRTVGHWEITTHGLFSGPPISLYTRAPEFELARGERVTVRAAMRDEPTPPPPPPNAAAPPSLPPDPAVVAALRNVVRTKERSRDLTQARVDADMAGRLELVVSQCDLAEARIRLAQAERDNATLIAELHSLVTLREEERQLTSLRVEHRVDPPDLLNQVDARVAEAKSRLAQAQGRPVPPAAVAPFDTAKAKELQEAWAKYLGVPVEFTNPVGMKLRVIPPGEYLRGSTPEEVRKAVEKLGAGYLGAVEAERPQHRVILDAPFALGATEVTRGQFRQFVSETQYKTEAERDQPIGHGLDDGGWVRKKEFNWDTNPGYRRPMTDADPVVNVTWNDAVEFCRWLSRKDGRTYTLPTEAQWEFACRAGTQTPWWTGDWEGADGHLRKATWYDKIDTAAAFKPVASFAPNPFGLYDMHGNVEEWCSDWYNDYPNDPIQRNPTGPASPTTARVVRSSNFNVGPAGMRSAYRISDDPNLPSAVRGFRVAVVGDLKPTTAAVAPFDATRAKEYQDGWAKRLGVPVAVTNTIGTRMRLVPPGEFPMTPDYRVTISKPFRIGAHEVTVRQFRIFVDETGYKTDAEKSGKGEAQRISGERDVGPEFTWRHKDVVGGDEHPVGQVSWNDAAAFCEWLSRKEKKTYRLPTEAEWEWACRAGSLAAYYFGDDPAALVEYAWSAENSGGKSHTVGSKRPNAWGLFDMHGNVSEHCLDWFDEQPATGRATDPRGPASGTRRIIRGYSFIDPPNTLTAAQRTHVHPEYSMHHFGFRIVCEVDAVTSTPPSSEPRPKP